MLSHFLFGCLTPALCLNNINAIFDALRCEGLIEPSIKVLAQLLPTPLSAQVGNSGRTSMETALGAHS